MISKQPSRGAIAPLFFALVWAGPALAFDPAELICKRGGFKTAESGQFREGKLEPDRVWYLSKTNRDMIKAGSISGTAELSALARTRAGNAFAVNFAKFNPPPRGASHLATEGVQTKLFSCDGAEWIGVWVDRSRLAWVNGPTTDGPSGVISEVRRMLDSGLLN